MARAKKQKPLIYKGHAMSFNKRHFGNGGELIEIGCRNHEMTFTVGESHADNTKFSLSVPKEAPIHVKAEGEASTEILADYLEFDIDDPAVTGLYYALASLIKKRGVKHERRS